MSEKPEVMVIELTISPDSAYHRSVGVGNLEELLEEHGIKVSNWDPCTDCPDVSGDREPRFDPNDLD